MAQQISITSDGRIAVSFSSEGNWICNVTLPAIQSSASMEAWTVDAVLPVIESESVVFTPISFDAEAIIDPVDSEASYNIRNKWDCAVNLPTLLSVAGTSLPIVWGASVTLAALSTAANSLAGTRFEAAARLPQIQAYSCRGANVWACTAIIPEITVNASSLARLLFDAGVDLPPISASAQFNIHMLFDVLAALPAVQTQALILQAITETFQGWVLNTKTQGAAQYDGYNFRQLVRVPANGGDRYFGCSSIGIYELTGPTDNGTAISAHGLSGVSSAGSDMVKYFPDAWLTLRCRGKMILSVATDEQPKLTYIVDSGGREGIHKVRPPYGLAQGVMGEQVQIGFANVDGADFMLKQIELDVAPSVNRRMRH